MSMDDGWVYRGKGFVGMVCGVFIIKFVGFPSSFFLLLLGCTSRLYGCQIVVL